MKKVLTRKGIVLIVIPLSLIFLQLFVRFLIKSNISYIGITLGALGIGQLCPYLYFDHLILNKAFSLQPDYKTEPGKLILEYSVQVAESFDKTKFELLKNLYILSIFLTGALFLFTIYFGLTGSEGIHVLLGVIICIYTWYLLIFKK